MDVQWKWLLAILVIAFGVRAAAAIGVQRQLDLVWKRQFVIEGDANGYWELARRIAEGESYEIYTPPRRVLRMPGFPTFLAITRTVFGDVMLGTRLSLCVVGTGACGIVYWLGRELVSERVGLIAAAWAAVHPVLVAFTPLILSETLFAACLAGSLVAIARLARRHRTSIEDAWFPAEKESGKAGANLQTEAPSIASTPVPRAILSRELLLALLCGVLIGVACYVRPSWFLAAPLYASLLLLSSRRRTAALLHGVLMMCGLLGVLLPWGLRNQQVTGHFVLTTLWAGPSLYDGLNPDATGDSDMTFYDQDNLLAQGLSEYEVDQHYRREAMDFVRDNPARTLELAVIKLGRFWSPVPNAEQFGSWTVRAIVMLAFVPMMLFALIGAWQMRRKPWVLALTLGPTLYFCALHLVFVSSLRYRLPAEYALLVLSAAGLDLAWRRWRERPVVPMQVLPPG